MSAPLAKRDERGIQYACSWSEANCPYRQAESYPSPTGGSSKLARGSLVGALDQTYVRISANRFRKFQLRTLLPSEFMIPFRFAGVAGGGLGQSGAGIHRRWGPWQLPLGFEGIGSSPARQPKHQLQPRHGRRWHLLDIERDISV